MLTKLLIVAILIASSIAEDASGSDRLQKLTQLRQKSGNVIASKTDLFETVIRPSPRPFTVVLLMNAVDPRHQCIPCQEASRDFITLADIYYATHNDSSVFFVQADFDTNQEVFQKLKLNSAPVMYHVLEKGGPKKCPHRPADGQAMTACLRQEHGINLKFYKPADPTATLVMVLLLVLLAVALYIAKDFLGKIFSRDIVAFMSIVFCGLMLGGTMWVQIRGPPYIAAGKDGKPNYIAGGSQSQYGAEAHIIAFLTVAVAACVIFLADHAARLNNAQITTGLTIVCAFLFSFLLSIFREKSYGYPFKFLF